MRMDMCSGQAGMHIHMDFGVLGQVWRGRCRERIGTSQNYTSSDIAQRRLRRRPNNHCSGIPTTNPSQYPTVVISGNPTIIANIPGTAPPSVSHPSTGTVPPRNAITVTTDATTPDPIALTATMTFTSGCRSSSTNHRRMMRPQL